MAEVSSSASSSGVSLYNSDYSNVLQVTQHSAGRFTHTSPPSLYTRALSSAPVLTRLLPKFYVTADKMCGEVGTTLVQNHHVNQKTHAWKSTNRECSTMHES